MRLCSHRLRKGAMDTMKSPAAFQTALPSPERQLCGKSIAWATSLFFSRCHDIDAGAPVSVFDKEHTQLSRHGRVDLLSPKCGKNTSPSSSRRSFLSLVTIAVTTAVPPFARPNAALPVSSAFVANAAETIGKDKSCNDASCLGVWDGLLADCPHGKIRLGGGAGCVSSQDDTPGIFAEPWDYSENVPLPSSAGGGGGSYEDQMDQLVLALQAVSKQRGDAIEVAYREGRYLRALVTDGPSGERSIAEFYFTPGDTTVQFRLASASPPPLPLGGASLPNAERAERVRRALRYLKVPVLRNRRRAFLFVESDGLDGFGPGSAALGPPEEMSPGEIALDGAMRYGFKVAGGGGGRTRRGSDDVDPRSRIDWVESFPFSGSR